jgi:hypothetical protein
MRRLFQGSNQPAKNYPKRGIYKEGSSVKIVVDI